MRVAAAVYMAGLLAANAGVAQEADLSALLTGDMRKLVLHEEPLAVPDTPFDADGAEMTLQDLQGRVAVVNFWATWCAPCRTEMPTLAALQEAVPDLRVATIAVGRQDPVEVDRFLREVGADALPRWRDPQQALARDMGVLGLPVTVILDAEGREVGRLTGDADWNGEAARALLQAIGGG